MQESASSEANVAAMTARGAMQVPDEVTSWSAFGVPDVASFETDAVYTSYAITKALRSPFLSFRRDDADQ